MDTVHWEMQPSLQLQPSCQVLQHSRTNTSELKSLIVKQVGVERAQCYFSCLNGFLSQKVSKSEFNKRCLLTLGRENLPLHNQLVQTILKNSFQAKAPPSLNHQKSLHKSTISFLKKFPQHDDGYNSLLSPKTSIPNSSNGVILPLSSCKFRIVGENHHSDNHPSPIGPNGRAQAASHQFAVPSDNIVIRDNGDLSPSYLKRLKHQEDGGMEQLSKRPQFGESLLLDHASIHDKDLVGVTNVEDRDTLHDWDSRGPIDAPIGIPFHSARVGGTRRPISKASPINVDFGRSCSCGELFHTEMLKERMNKIVEAQGLGGVTMDCANLLNKSLDAYLKQLIRSCAELVGTRTGHDLIEESVPKLQSYRKPINGTWVGNSIQAQSVGGSSNDAHNFNNCHSVTMQDFNTAMGLNPEQLGVNWPLLLEKISFRSFEE
ncbi:hypothetical protein Cni_G22635 [Canna indica]|uniref:Transcriptional coactivator Hfi1/Transcriptional adapter 1 n=1 Tax=Canna indica TaxID=4628 RepID=A0AAQ3KSI5_9LILI|nr:hypothetical protein Cni_G22635 [Canna indica]